MCEYFICFFAQLMLNGSTFIARNLWMRWVAGALSFVQLSSHLLWYRCLGKLIICCYKFSCCCCCFARGLRGILLMISDCSDLWTKKEKEKSNVQTKQSSTLTGRLCWHTWGLYHVMCEHLPPCPSQLPCLSWAWNRFFLTLSLFFVFLQRPKCNIPPW